MDLYHKPTDTQRCLLYSTSHPKHCLKNIPFAMARRICTIVGNISLKKKHLTELKENCRTYGYPKIVVEIGIKKAKSFLKANYANIKQLGITII